MEETQRRWDEHPDLALARQDGLRGICCIALRGAPDAQLDALARMGAFCTYREGEDAALLYAQDEGVWSIEKLTNALKSLGLQAGLSGPFALAASAHGCMLKAQIALETGLAVAPGRTVYPMGEFGEAALLRAARQALARQGFAPGDFLHEALGRMARMDAQRDTQYLRSLDAYLGCGRDMKRAAQALGVHRNTLDYRLSRIGELFALNLGDMNTCFELLFSLWLMKNLPAQAEAPADAPFDARAAQAALWRHVERRSDGEPSAGASFSCALLCVSVEALPDDGRYALLSGLREAGRGLGAAFAFDEDVLLAALAPERMAAFEAVAVPLCTAQGCPAVITQAFPAGRIDARARLCRMALCAASSLCTRTQDMGSTLLFMVMERCCSLAPYLCEEVIRVMDDDAQKGTALSRSLYAYLLHFRDMKLAAQQLHMHRNTMEYHMRKIDALIGETAGQERRFMMMCTYKMLALPQLMPHGL